MAVVVPAYNEEKLIDRVLDTMPSFVDRVIVVDDASTDGTAAALASAQARNPPASDPAAKLIDFRPSYLRPRCR